jgi:hypothetical protein
MPQRPTEKGAFYSYQQRTSATEACNSFQILVGKIDAILHHLDLGARWVKKSSTAEAQNQIAFVFPGQVVDGDLLAHRRSQQELAG